METIRFLNVKEGDCSIIQHPSGRVSVIDVCNAKPPDSVSAAIEELAKMMVDKAPGNFNQKAHPVNPIAYLNDHSIKSIFRYIQTHPDMDHMDGIKCFFETFSPINFWDTDNKKELAASDWGGSPYNAETGSSTRICETVNPRATQSGLLTCLATRDNIGTRTRTAHLAVMASISLPPHRS